MKSKRKNKLEIAASALVCVAMTSCSLIYDYEGDCQAEYRVRFVDDLNLKAADAFNTEVKSVSLYAFNESGDLVWSDSKTINDFNADGDTEHTIDISALSPGKYSLIAWGGIYESKGSFGLPKMTRAPQAKITDLSCRLGRQEAEEYDFVDTDLDDLFHGSAEITIPEDGDGASETIDIHLTKNTNRINVLLQQINGEALDPDDYEFVIEAGNGELDYDNSIMVEDKPFIYRAYEKLGGSTQSDDSTDATTMSALMARFTINRLALNDWGEYTRPMLTIYNVTTDEKILSIPLIDYALLVRNNYDNVTSDQDYLDKQDEYNITFFLTNGRWLDSTVVINSWRIVFNNEEL